MSVTNEHSAEAISAELSRVLDSPRFDASERNRRFLEFVVQETLTGRPERIKGYTIATTVFGRDANFDPQRDPIVRMEARRLRRSLERFYLTEGTGSRLRIVMLKGSYVPTFQEAALRSQYDGAFPTDVTTGVSGRQHGPSIFVAPFEMEGDESVFPNLNHGFMRQMIVGLTRFSEFFVVGADAILGHSPGSDRGEGHATLNETDFVLTGGTAVFADTLNVKAIVVHVLTGQVLWGANFERRLQLSGILTTRDEVADCIVRALAEPYGVIFNRLAEEVECKEPEALTWFDSVIRFYQYQRSYSRDTFRRVRECLEQTVIRDRNSGEALACLSQLCSDGHRFGFARGESSAELQRRALAFAHRAIELAPYSSRGYHALGMAHWFSGDAPACIRALQDGLAINPNASEVMADLGLCWTLLAEWTRGVPLIEQALARNPTLPSTHRMGLSLYYFVQGRFEEALAEAHRIDVPDVTHGLVAQAISLIRLDRTAEAAESVRRILEIEPQYGRAVLADLAGGNLNQELAHRVMNALHDAGLPTDRMPALRLAR